MENIVSPSSDTKENAPTQSVSTDPDSLTDNQETNHSALPHESDPKNTTEESRPEPTTINISPEDLSKKIHRFLVMGNNLQEIKKDALSQGISEKIWNDAVEILFPPKKKSFLKRFIFLFGAFFVLLLSLLGYLYFRFSETETAKKSSAPLTAFFQGFLKSPLTFSQLIFSKNLDSELLKNKKTEDSNISKEIEIKEMVVPASTVEESSETNIPPSSSIEIQNKNEPSSPTTPTPSLPKKPKPATISTPPSQQEPKPIESAEDPILKTREIDSRNPLGVKRRKF